MASSHVPADRRGDRQQADRGAVLEAGVLRLREVQGVDGEGQARRRASWSTTTTPRRSRSRSMPTFALGCAAEFPPADEGWGPRPVPVVKGHPELASHIAQSVILDEFDLTIVQQDGGRPRPHRAAQPAVRLAVKEWPCPVIPLAVNVVQYPPPTGNRCYDARQGDPQGGRVLSRGPATSWCSAPAACRTRSRPARRPDQQQVRQGLPRRPHQGPEEAHRACSHLEFMREAGAEGIEMVMWLIMRGALDDKVDGGLSLLHRAGLEHRGRAHHPGERREGAAKQAGQ